jgi:Cdc6-like AAA superfamily ATPase
MSVVNEALLDGDTAQPVLLLDELDKFQTHGDEQPYHVLLTMLEAENSRQLLDEYLRVSFNLSHAIIIATANDTDRLPDFIRDRLITFDIAPPTSEALLRMTRRIAMIAVAETNGLMGVPDDAVIQRLARANPRRITRVVRLALGYAAAAGRDHLTVADVEAADRLGRPTGNAQAMGFLGADRGS